MDDQTALIQLGTQWEASEKNEGTKGQLVSRGVIGGSKSNPPIVPTLEDLGIDKKTAHFMRKLARLANPSPL